MQEADHALSCKLSLICKNHRIAHIKTTLLAQPCGFPRGSALYIILKNRKKTIPEPAFPSEKNAKIRTKKIKNNVLRIILNFRAFFYSRRNSKRGRKQRLSEVLFPGRSLQPGNTSFPPFSGKQFSPETQDSEGLSSDLYYFYPFL